MSDRENEKALESLSYLGLDKNSKWICIHNRDSAYLNWLEPNRDWCYHDFRDWPIDDMRLAIKYFVKKGFIMNTEPKARGILIHCSPKVFVSPCIISDCYSLLLSL